MENNTQEMVQGTIVRLSDRIQWGPKDYMLALMNGHPLPEHNTEYYCTGTHQDKCPNCEELHTWIGLKGLVGGEQVWQADSFEVVRPPMDVDNLILDAFANQEDDHQRDGEVD